LKLFAVSDLHVDHRINLEALRALPDHGGDWLITGGDICTHHHHLRETLDVLCDRFARVFWVPGNHELWSSRAGENLPLERGTAKYRAQVAICREYGVATPEDPFVPWPPDPALLIAPLFIGYDYSFRPDDIPLEEAINWAMESGVLCSDEKLLEPEPYASIVEWCTARLAYTTARLDAVPPGSRLILVNHFPLRRDLVRLMKRLDRFVIWCGTRQTEDLHQKYPVEVVVSGHLHVPATDYRDGVRFEEVSLGYPRNWRQDLGVDPYLRQILPAPPGPAPAGKHTTWRYL